MRRLIPNDTMDAEITTCNLANKVHHLGKCFIEILEIVSKFGFKYWANLSELISFYSSRNHQKTVVSGGIEAKLVSAIYFFYQMIALQKLWQMHFILSKKLFSFSRYSNICDYFPSFPHFPGSKGQMKVVTNLWCNDVMNWFA